MKKSLLMMKKNITEESEESIKQIDKTPKQEPNEKMIIGVLNTKTLNI